MAAAIPNIGSAMQLRCMKLKQERSLAPSVRLEVERAQPWCHVIWPSALRL